MLSRHLLQNLLHKIHKRRGRSRYVFKYSGNQVYHGTLRRKEKKKRKHEIPPKFTKKKTKTTTKKNPCKTCKSTQTVYQFPKALRKTCWAC